MAQSLLTPAEVAESIGDESSIHYLSGEECRTALALAAGFCSELVKTELTAVLSEVLALRSLPVSFLDAVTAGEASHAAQPQKPTGSACGCGLASVGWAWREGAWKAACPAHIQGHPASQIFNTEFLGDDE